MKKNKRKKLPVQPIESKAQITKTIKKALIQERNAGNLPSDCRIKIGWIDRLYATELHITISGLDLKTHTPKVGKDGKLSLSPENKKLNDTLRKVLKNNKIEHFHIEPRFGENETINELEE
jgi:hypothetical protein